jgi:hypothetical protein
VSRPLGTSRGLGLLFAATALVGCGSDRVAGGSSTETSNRLAARFVDEEGQSAAGAVVRIRPSGWTGLASDSVSSGLWRTRLDTSLDASGSLDAAGFADGSYTIEIASPGLSLRRLLATGQSVVLDTLREPGGLAGRFSPNWAGSVRVLGTDRIIVSDSEGAFLDPSMPSGPVVLELRADSAGVTRRAQVRTSVPPRATADLGQVRLLTLEEENATLWRNRQRFVIDNTTTGLTRDVPDFPLWIPLPDSVRRGLQPEGADLRVLDENGSFRPLEMTSSALAGIWARMPRIDGSSNEHHLDLLWGRTDVPSWSEPRSVFDPSAGWLGVWHFDGASSCATDACGPFRGTARYDAGIAGRSLRFDGSSSLRTSDSGSLEPPNLSVSLWVHLEALTGSEARLVWKDSDGQSALPSWGILVRKSGSGFTVGFRTRNGPSDSGVFAPLPASRWVHLAATIERSRQKAELFVDGVSKGSFEVDSLAPAPRRGDMVVGQGLVGRIDELRVSGLSRPNAWFELEHINLTMPGTLLRR